MGYDLFSYDASSVQEVFAGGFLGGIGGGLAGALGATAILVSIFLFMVFYVYFAWAWMTIAQKMKHKYSWLAWIPFANIGLILDLGKFHWAWTFLILIPIFGWIALFVLLIIATWRIFEARKYPGWFSLAMILPDIGSILYAVVIGFVAWKDRKKEIKFS